MAIDAKPHNSVRVIVKLFPCALPFFSPYKYHETKVGWFLIMLCVPQPMASAQSVRCTTQNNTPGFYLDCATF